MFTTQKVNYHVPGYDIVKDDMIVAAKFEGYVILYKDKDLFLAACDKHNEYMTVIEEDVPLPEEAIIEAFVFFLRSRVFLPGQDDKCLLLPKEFFYNCVKKTRWNKEVAPICSTYEQLINTSKEKHLSLYRGLRLTLGYHVMRYGAETHMVDETKHLVSYGIEKIKQKKVDASV